MQQRPRAIAVSFKVLAALSLFVVGCGIEGTGEIGDDSPYRITPVGPSGVSSRTPTSGSTPSNMPTPPSMPDSSDPTTPPTPPSVTPPPTTDVPPPSQPPTQEPPPPAAMPTGTLVPLYTRPTDPSWSQLIAAKQAHPKVPVVAVVNPSNGPGASISKEYAEGITRLAAAGIRVVGYVSTAYAARSEADVKADIDTWKAFYPEVSGIFFDEQANKVGHEAYYRTLSEYARSRGLTFTVGNPGHDTLPSYIGTVDLILIYESSGLPDLARMMKGWHAEHDRRNFGVIPYGIPMSAEFVKAAKPFVSYIYLTSDVLPNPWDSLPAYFNELMAALSTT